MGQEMGNTGAKRQTPNAERQTVNALVQNWDSTIPKAEFLQASPL
jgi:hypothetical protein